MIVDLAFERDYDTIIDTAVFKEAWLDMVHHMHASHEHLAIRISSSSLGGDPFRPNRQASRISRLLQ